MVRSYQVRKGDNLYESKSPLTTLCACWNEAFLTCLITFHPRTSAVCHQCERGQTVCRGHSRRCRKRGSKASWCWPSPPLSTWVKLKWWLLMWLWSRLRDFQQPSSALRKLTDDSWWNNLKLNEQEHGKPDQAAARDKALLKEHENIFLRGVSSSSPSSY
jgi:hypothetical protein